MKELYDRLLAFTDAHPHLADMIFVWILLPTLALILKKLSQRFSILAELFEGVGLDAKKITNALRRAVKLPPLPALFMFFCVAIVTMWTLALFAAGCGGSNPGVRSPARDYARATVLLVAEGAKAADSVCADLAKQKRDVAIAKTCADAYDACRSSLLAAQSLVDAWQATDQKSYVCTVAHGVQALGAIATAIQTAGGPPLPAATTDALSLGGELAKGCT